MGQLQLLKLIARFIETSQKRIEIYRMVLDPEASMRLSAS